MNLGNYLFQLPSIQKNKYRTYEKVSKKLINSTWSLEFNKISSIYECKMNNRKQSLSIQLIVNFRFN